MNRFVAFVLTALFATIAGMNVIAFDHGHNVWNAVFAYVWFFMTGLMLPLIFTGEDNDK